MKNIIKLYSDFLNEELNVKGTYFTSQQDNIQEVEKEFQKIVYQIAKEENISLPVKAW